MNQSIRPEDILSDSEQVANFNGVMVRKGSIAAFLKNIDLFESPQSSPEEKQAALATMKELAPALVAAGFTKHARFKNPTIQALFP